MEGKHKDWVHQTEGEIDHYNPDIHKGNQPVRVLHNISLYKFIHEKDGFYQKLVNSVLDQEMDPQVEIVTGDVPIRTESGTYRTPRIDTKKQLKIHETFLSYIWTITYSIFVLYVEKIHHPLISCPLKTNQCGLSVCNSGC